MVDSDNKYTKMQKAQYEKETELMAKEDHKSHNNNPDYWDILLAPVDDLYGTDVKALDFGCGTGRNVLNLLETSRFDEVWGADISETNVAHCRDTMHTRYSGKSRFEFSTVSGVDLQAFDSHAFNFVMSTIVLQHICVHDIRFQLLEEFYRVLDFQGDLSIQMGFGPSHPRSRGYYENFYEAQQTNSGCDTRVEHPHQLVGELAMVGFKDIQYSIRDRWDDSHDQWIYVQARK